MSGKDELRDAVVVAWKLHVKWTLRRDASITSWFTVGPGAPLNPQGDLYRELLGFTLFMADGKHLMVQVLEEEAIKLYDYTRNVVVWDSHWLSQLGCLDCTVYEGRLLLIFEVTGDMELLVLCYASLFTCTDYHHQSHCKARGSGSHPCPAQEQSSLYPHNTEFDAASVGCQIELYSRAVRWLLDCNE